MKLGLNCRGLSKHELELLIGLDRDAHAGGRQRIGGTAPWQIGGG